MKKSVLALFLLSAATLLAATPNPADYPVSVHVISSSVNVKYEGEKSPTYDYEDIHVLINGNKYTLETSDHSLVSAGPLAPGDYPAKVVENLHQRKYTVVRHYVLLFPDGKTATFFLNGRSE